MKGRLIKTEVGYMVGLFLLETDCGKMVLIPDLPFPTDLQLICYGITT